MRSHAGLRQAITVLAAFLARNEEYAVVAIDGEENETALGTMKARGRAGLAGLLVDTGRADELPASLADLAGQRVEVRDGDGNVALEGVFPELR